MIIHFFAWWSKAMKNLAVPATFAMVKKKALK